MVTITFQVLVPMLAMLIALLVASTPKNLDKRVYFEHHRFLPLGDLLRFMDKELQVFVLTIHLSVKLWSMCIMLMSNT